MREISLKDLTNNGEVRNLAGYECGRAAREKYHIDDIDRTGEEVCIVIPDDVYTITVPFFQGMFAESVHKAGSRENFLNQFKFDVPLALLSQVDHGVRSSLMKRDSASAA